MHTRELSQGVVETNCGSGLFVLNVQGRNVAALLPSGRYVATPEAAKPALQREVNRWLLGVSAVHTIEEAELDRLAGQPFVINRERFEQIQRLTQA